MKKMMMVLIMVFTMVAGFISCATTSGIDTSEIKESKLTSISYLKKICDVKLVYSEKGCKLYLLDDGKGYFYQQKERPQAKVCLIIKDGELYGRTKSYVDRDTTVTFNLHDSRCKYDSAYFYYDDEAIDKMTKYLKDGMIKLSKEWGLEKYVNNIE